MNATIAKNVMLAKKIVATAMVLALSTIADARDNALTVYAGYRGGGSFTDATTEQGLSLENSSAASLALDIGLDASRQLQLFINHQRTDLSLDATSPLAGGRLGMNITYLHIGGTNFFNGAIGRGPYVVGGVGATLFDPEAGFRSEVRASLNIGIGYQLPLGDTLALRFEARGYATLVNSSGGLFCSGGCVFVIKGDTVTQGEAMLGLSARF